MKVDLKSITVEEMNAIVRRNLTVGSGLFTAALREELEKRHTEVPFLAHDLIGELDGERSGVGISVVSSAGNETSGRRGVPGAG
jgi:hypothetical protein